MKLNIMINYTFETLPLDAQIQTLKRQERDAMPKFPVSSITRELKNRGWVLEAAKFHRDYSAEHLMTQSEIEDAIKIAILSTRSYVADSLAIGLYSIVTSLAKNVVEYSWSERVENV